MKDENNILNQLKRREKPAVPVDFFDRFSDELMLRIETESGILGQLKKAEKPTVPEGFFDTLLPDVTTDEAAFSVADLKKSPLPSLPANYFEEFSDQLMETIHPEEKKKGRIIPMRLISAVVAVAAVFTLIFTVVDFGNEPQEDSHSVAPLAEVEEEEQYDDYLAYLDEAEIIDFIVESNIELENTTDEIQYEDYSEFSGEDLEEYYLEL